MRIRKADRLSRVSLCVVMDYEYWEISTVPFFLSYLREKGRLWPCTKPALLAKFILTIDTGVT